MGACLQKSQYSKSNYESLINQTLQQDKQYAKESTKLLMIGVNKGGKTTIIQQLNAIHNPTQFNNNHYKSQFIPDIHDQCIKQMQLILQLLDDKFYYPSEEKEYSLSPQNIQIKQQFMHETEYKKILIYGYIHNAEKQLLSNANAILSNECIHLIDIYISDKNIINACTDTKLLLSPRRVDLLKNLWMDPAVKKMYSNAKVSNIFETTAYFWDDIDRLCEYNYIPTSMDLLSLYWKKSSKIEEKEFIISNQKITIIDPSGQQNERKKWIEQFEDVDAVIFVVSLAWYDMEWDSKTDFNMMEEALLLLQEIGRKFWNTQIFVLLNKTDVFKEKIKMIPITVCSQFDEYKGDVKSYEECIAFIENVFANGSEYQEDLNIKCMQICAMDKETIENVFNDIVKCLIVT
eukprot:550080_1